MESFRCLAEQLALYRTRNREPARAVKLDGKYMSQNSQGLTALVFFLPKAAAPAHRKHAEVSEWRQCI